MIVPRPVPTERLDRIAIRTGAALGTIARQFDRTRSRAIGGIEGAVAPETFLIRRAGHLLSPPRVEIADTPRDPHDDLSLALKDGAVLRAWRLRAVSSPHLGTVFFLHGHGGNRSSGLRLAKGLANDGFDVVLMDQRAHGQSGGSYCTFGVRERHDVVEAMNAWGKKGPIYLAGHSMGAGIATQVAAIDKRVAGVVTFASFCDLRRVFEERYLEGRSREKLRFSDRVKLWVLETYVGRKYGFYLDDVSPSRLAPQVACPFLLVHGEQDTSVPPHHSHTLAEVLGDKARLVLCDGDHEFVVMRRTAVNAARAFLLQQARARDA